MINDNISYEGYVGNILYDAIRNSDGFIAKYKSMAIRCSQEHKEYQAFHSEKIIFENRHYMILSNSGNTRELNVREFPEDNQIRALDIYFITRDYNDVKGFAEKQYAIAKEQYIRDVPEYEWESSCRNLPFNIEEMYFKFNFKPYGGLNKLFSLHENRKYEVYMRILYKLR